MLVVQLVPRPFIAGDAPVEEIVAEDRSRTHASLF
jgi:hypothetical protein